MQAWAHRAHGARAMGPRIPWGLESPCGLESPQAPWGLEGYIDSLYIYIYTYIYIYIYKISKGFACVSRLRGQLPNGLGFAFELLGSSLVLLSRWPPTGGPFLLVLLGSFAEGRPLRSAALSQVCVWSAPCGSPAIYGSATLPRGSAW
jgi:hypothetical protein